MLNFIVNKNKKNKYGFTLVELLVVILILVILGTIAFISINGYSKSSRDARRISDISNIKKSLELFAIKTGKYPIADNSTSISFSGDLLWKQGTLGDNVFKNLSRNLQKKPLDPLYEIEYIYSSTNTQKEYEIMSLYESEVLSKNLLTNEIYANSNLNTRVEGSFNQLFVMTPNYLFPTPSIISSINNNIDMTNSDALNSMLITNGENFPDISILKQLSKTGALDLKLSSHKAVNLKSLDDDKVSAIETIQQTFSGTKLQNEILYKMVLSKQTYDQKLQLANWIFGGDFVGTRLISGNEEIPDTTAPILSLLGPSGTLGVSPVTLTVTTNENAICYFDETEIDYLLMSTFEESGNAVHNHSYLPIEGENNINVICRDLSDNESELGIINFIYTPSSPINIIFTENNNEVYTCDLCE